MTERVLRGLAAAGGVAAAEALVLREPELSANGAGGEGEQARALEALAEVARELGAAAARLRDAGLVDEAEIVEANRLMAEDPALASEVATLALEVMAEIAVVRATERHATLLAELGDPLLAARAADVREVGRRAARVLTAAPPLRLPDTPVVLVARDLGAAEISELQLAAGTVAGIALADGSATSHAAIVARALDLPLVVALGQEVFTAAEGDMLVLDGDRGRLVVRPTAATLAEARYAQHRALETKERLVALRGRPPVTRDGRRVALLANAATSVDVAAGLRAGAEGVGLLRTELAFLEAHDWPSEAEQFEALEKPLALLRGRVATVRTLDFGQDKTPPFLAGVAERGLELALAHPDALSAQLRAILRAGQAVRLRVLLPLVESREQLREVRALLHDAAAAVGVAVPPLGAMIETPLAAARARELAAEADFLSIGTNDLVQYTLGLDREAPLATVRTAADPAVLRHVASAGVAAAAVGVALEVCGEAAGIPPLAALFVGLGVGELSTAPARLDEIRAAVRGLSAAQARSAARAALDDPDAAAVLARAEVLLSELGDEIREAVGRRGGVVA